MGGNELIESLVQLRNTSKTVEKTSLKGWQDYRNGI